ncbi:hypothetical protein UFOVP87_49 [uncultured Caudovirales phage]|uniref:Uncharacterized protein n=1 Tax=uncultured Caudovirales phage TaxID=2100421 RepID=A0A6J5L5E9_9CAUD|nr:hypothetical protein UFOVP87_49 [uncultured Caudovirales phage]
MERTAMQELQRRLFDVGTKTRPITVDEMNGFIEKEKQQIIDAYIDRIKDTYQNRTEAEQYYNQTFKQD